jgi:hypothetical protein
MDDDRRRRSRLGHVPSHHSSVSLKHVSWGAHQTTLCQHTVTFFATRILPYNDERGAFKRITDSEAKQQGLIHPAAPRRPAGRGMRDGCDTHIRLPPRLRRCNAAAAVRCPILAKPDGRRVLRYEPSCYSSLTSTIYCNVGVHPDV